MKALNDLHKLTLFTIILLSLYLYSDSVVENNGIENNNDDSLEYSGDIDSIKFVEVIKDIHVDESEHSLIIESIGFKSCAYRDTSSILQLIEVTKDFKWAILISMPSEIDGRSETTYLLVDIENREIYNSTLEKIAGNYISGSDIYFNTSTNGKIYLTYTDKSGKDFTIELR